MKQVVDDELLKNLSPKERLECLKIQDEILELRRPVYKKVSFYTAFTPIVLTATGLFITQQSGWFDVKRQELENTRTLIESETEALRSEKTKLEIETNQLESDRTNVQGQLSALDKERSDMRAQLEVEKKALDDQIGDLRQQLNEQTKQSEKQLQITRRMETINRVNDLLNSVIIKRDTYSSTVSIANPGADTLISMLRNGGDVGEIALEAIENKLKDAKADMERAAYLYLLYKGTGSLSWRDNLYLLVDRPLDELYFYYIFTQGEWTELEMTNALIRTITSVKEQPLNYKWYYVLLQDFEWWSKIREDPAMRGVFLDASSLAIRRTRGAGFFLDKQDGLRVLWALSPIAYYSNISELIRAHSAHQMPDEQQAREKEMLEESLANIYRYRNIDDYKSGYELGMRLQVPGLNGPAPLDFGAWERWRAKYTQMVTYWTDPDLKVLRSQPDRLAQALNPS
jgi:hypothetical protein